MNPAIESRIVVFGKIPSYGDFVQLNCSGPVWRRFDEWLQEATSGLRRALGNRFKSLLGTASPFRFLFSVREAGGILSGVVQPSSDRVGRFAFLVLADVRPATAGPLQDTSWPVTMRRFYLEAQDLASRAAAGGLSKDAFVSAALALSRDYADTEHASYSSARDEVVVSELRQTIGSVKRDQIGRFTLSFRLPIVHEVTEMSVADWLRAAVHMVDDMEQSNPCAFWHDGTSEGGSGSLILSVSQPSPNILSSVLDESSEHDQVLSLVEAR